MARTGRRRSRQRKRRWLKVVMIIALILAAGSLYLMFRPGGLWSPSIRQKPIILYVNQGNGVVNGSGFGAMLDFASAAGFNTVFFQVYRAGSLLFSPSILQSFVNQTHQAGLKIFFALYITNTTQKLPISILGLHEDGVSLDMSSLDVSAQQTFLVELESNFPGETAVTTTNMSSTLKPDLLVLETYSADENYGAYLRGFIRSGIVASVGVFDTPNADVYNSQFQYALQNSEGVMVFDYAGLKRAGY
jgi:hypothetical protein